MLERLPCEESDFGFYMSKHRLARKEPLSNVHSEAWMALDTSLSEFICYYRAKFNGIETR